MIDAPDPRRTALLLMDLQPAIVGSLDGAPALLDWADRAAAKARAAGWTVVWVRVALTDEERAAVPDRNKIFALAASSGLMGADDPSTQLHPDLTVAPDDVVVRKHRVGAFSTTDLADRLAERGIDTLVLAGVSTSGVVLSTTRDAADHDYRLFVVADRCLDRDPEVHRVLVERVLPRQADVIDADTLNIWFDAQA